MTQWGTYIFLTQVWKHFPTPFQIKWSSALLSIASKGLKVANNTELPSLFQLSVSLFSLSYSLQFLISLSFTSSLATQPSLLARACPIASRRLWRTRAPFTLHYLTLLHQSVWSDGSWKLLCDSCGQRWQFHSPFGIYMSSLIPWPWWNKCLVGVTRVEMGQ